MFFYNEIKILLNKGDNKYSINSDYMMIDFPKILKEINDFALYSENASDDEILENLKEEEEKKRNDILQKIRNFEKEKEKIFKKKYNSDRVLFNSYLYSYLLLYLFETFKSKDNNIKKIKIQLELENNEEICLDDCVQSCENELIIQRNYVVNYDYMYEILKKLVHDKFPCEESYDKNYGCKKLIINYNEIEIAHNNIINERNEN